MFAFRHEGAVFVSSGSTVSAIRSINSSSGKSLAMVPPLSELGAGARQEALDRLLCLSGLRRHIARRRFFPVTPYQRQPVLFGKARHHSPGVFANLFLFQQTFEIRKGRQNLGVAVQVVNGSWST